MQTIRKTATPTGMSHAVIARDRAFLGFFGNGLAVTLLAGALLTPQAQAEVALPAEYKQLDWIATTGTESKWINTEYVPLYNDVVEAVIEVPVNQPSTWTTFFGVNAEGGSLTLALRRNTLKLYAYFANTGSINGANPDMFYNQKILVRCDGTSMRWKPVGAAEWTETLSLSESQVTYTLPMYIFCRNDKGDCNSPGWGKLFSFKITSGGEVKRDYVPCRNENGDAGLWDKAGGRFYSRQGLKGAAPFVGSDDKAELALNWIGNYISEWRWINSGWIPNYNDIIEAVIEVPKKQYGTWTAFFGTEATGGSYMLCVQRNQQGKYCYYGNGKDTYGSQPLGFYDQPIELRCDGKSMSWKPVGDAQWAETLAGDETQVTYTRPMYLFVRNEAGKGGNNPAWGKLFSFKVTSGGVVIHDFQPWRTIYGQTGLRDKIGGRFHDESSLKTFQYGLAYLKEGTSLYVSDGTLSDSDLTGCETVEKFGSGEVNAAQMTGCPALALSAGAFSLQDGAVKDYAVDGALALKGGVRLSVDASVKACDRFTAESLDLSAASPESPVTIAVTLTEGTAALKAVRFYPVISASGISKADAAKFKVVGIEHAKVAFYQGALGIVDEDWDPVLRIIMR